MKEDLSSLNEELQEAMSDYITNYKREIDNYSKRLEALSPLKVLSRGYSITESEDGRVITSINDINSGEQMTTILKDGRIVSKIIDKKED